MKNSPHHIKKWPINALLYLTLALFLVGIFAPIMTVTKLIWISNTVSIVGAIIDLTAEHEWFLAIVIFLFSIVFPLAKITLLGLIWNRYQPHNQTDDHKRPLGLLEKWGKWSMLDVFLAAIIVATIKLGMLANVEVHFGVYSFGASVILTITLTTLITKRIK